MTLKPSPFDIGPAHLVGIGGIGMSGIAEIMMNLGYKVQGSDVKDSANVERLREKGATVHVASPDGQPIRGWDETDWGREAEVDDKIDEIRIDAYDAVVLPGGQINPDILRTKPEAVKLVTSSRVSPSRKTCTSWRWTLDETQNWSVRPAATEVSQA